MAAPYVLKETPWKTVKDIQYDMAILPWGATEAHNYHLPYGTDSIETDFIAAEAARKAWEKGSRPVVLPVIPYGVNTGQLDIYMTINMNPDTQYRILEDILQSLSYHGINKLVIFNGHGGNDFKTMIRQIQPRFPDILLFQLNWFDAVPLEEYFEEGGDHANEMETSVIMKVAPGLVLPLSEAGEGRAKKPRFRARKEGWVWFPREWTRVTDDTGIGNPKKASSEKGGRYLNDITDKISDFFVELSKTDRDNLYE